MQSFGISFNDLSQIDEFIEHAQFHNEQYGDSVFVFMSKHYGELKADHNKEHQEEKENHEQLPFQNQTNVSLISAFTLNSNNETFKTPEPFELKSYNFYYLEPTSSVYSSGPFQPPRQS
tara:strand:+ start:462 stop:818 length:357 start_codon:yes stop_codon:yes gene_type:complete